MYAEDPYHPIFNRQQQELLFSLDPIFAQIHDAHGAPAITGRTAGFESLCRIILDQQVSLSSGLAAFNSLDVKTSGISPSSILQLSDEDFKSAGISRQKTLYIRLLAERIISGDLDLADLATQDPEEIRNKLIESKGVGHWTVDVYLLFCLQHPDVFPIGDLAARKAAEKLTQIDNLTLLSERIKQWAPARSLAAFYLWHFYLEEKKKKK